MCQHEKIEANPICNCDSNIAFIYYWWNAGTASSTAFRLVITNHSGYIGLRRCIDNRTSAEIFRQEVRCLGVSMLPFFNQKELVVCSNQSQYQKYTSLLEKAGITYRTKARDLSSPSLFSMGTRERAGTAFQKINYQMLYTIYVVLTLIVAEIGSFFDLLNINPWCYPVYAALLILYNKFSSYNPISENLISKIIAICFIVAAVALTIIKGLVA